MTMVMKLGVRVVDGECIPVAGLEIGARYKYEHSSSAWSSETTDGDAYPSGEASPFSELRRGPCDNEIEWWPEGRRAFGKAAAKGRQ